ncbi:MAG: 1-acyl-sn-glycerol-3-phosphate acyltransferase [Cyanobacteria bacterium SZAS LIN-5]|nr:1-acyl-sn-glycerol-3-phosphate acyltransferase [Cyanobacteria bacterium SZAS LIN-5]RTL40711.1 MAG: 1-acyl-sn-glycerol-3-phosphate acyltransferase [Candidatus Melainabacteria bacterium]
MNQLVDRKSWWSVGILNVLNNICLNVHFNSIEISGQENLPADGPYILISNHYSRWDPPLVQKVLERRRAIYMASPNEMKGLQGAIIPGIGAFPAVASRAAYDFILNQFRKKEVLVVFPEGNVFRDGTTHPFKPGVARIALNCQATGTNIPVVPMAIRYVENGDDRFARISIGKAVDVSEYVEDFKVDSTAAIKTLSNRLHREVCHLKLGLGLMHDRGTVYVGKPVREWIPRIQDQVSA